MIAIFDIDSLIYEACYGAVDFDDATESFWSRYNDAEYNLQMKYGSIDMIPVEYITVKPRGLLGYDRGSNSGFGTLQIQHSP